ncbi:MAG TPA: cobalt transporter CbiM [Blastocatellia bacterium]
MHIPDGYLSPSTCAALYGCALPFWYVSMQKVRRLLTTRVIPLLSVFAAFSFVVMMFNLPLPGGTTGHAVGMGIATIVLGPWASILALSVALTIQALFFGDGGITTLGANCFNMAIVGSLVAYGVYRLISGRSQISSARRVIAAGLAGYLAINASALLAAIEFGIQPLLFKSASGAPLYAAYPLHIAIPAMMIGHLTFAGLAEMIISAGVVSYLQRADPSLLARTAPGVAIQNGEMESPHRRLGWRSARPLWIGVASLLVLTPLGLLAAGSAWGEWAPGDYTDPVTRQQIAAASRNEAPPETPPEGFGRLSRLWTAPMSHYSPSFMKSQSFGYLMSAAVGVGLIILAFSVIGSAAAKRSRDDLPSRVEQSRALSPIEPAASTPLASKPRGGRGFLERSIDSLLALTEHSLTAEGVASSSGLLQSLDPRVKVIGLLSLVIAVVLSEKLVIIVGLFAAGVTMALLSAVSVRHLATRVWVGALIFSGVIAFPSIFLVPGAALWRVPLLGWTATSQGLTSASFLISRVETAITFSTLLILCTPWTHVMKALKTLGVPSLLIVVLGMTYRFIFVMLRTAKDMLESRRSRVIGRMNGAEQRRLAASTVGVLLNKSMHLSGEIYLAMLSRGFTGNAYSLDEFEMKSHDWAALAGFILLSAAAIWLGR